MPNIVILRADHRIEIRLILVEHGKTVAVGIRVGCGVGIQQLRVVGDQHQANGHLALVHQVDAIDRGGDRRHRG